MRRNLLILFLCIVAGFLIGSIFEPFKSITFEAKANLDKVFELSVNILIAVVISLVLAKRNNEARTEKDILIKEIVKIIDDLRSLENLVNTMCQNGNIHQDNAKILYGQCKLIGQGLQYCLKLAEVYGFKITEDFKTKFWSSFLGYRKTLTGRPLNQYGARDRIEIHQSVSKLKTKINEYIVMINRS